MVEFKELDIDGDNKLNKRELFALFDAKSEYWSRREAHTLIQRLDEDGDELLSFDELRAGTPEDMATLFPEQKFHPLI